MYLFTILLVLSSFAATAIGAPRIVGGHDAPEHAYRYQVSLQQFGRHFCSGSIITARYVLTAAHCLDDVYYKDIEVVAGTNHLDHRPQVYSIEAAIIHENYVNYFDYDIALLKIARDFEFNPHVQPVIIPERDLTYYNKTVVFSGWGYLDANHPEAPNNLQESFLNLYKYDYDNEVLRRHLFTLNKEGEGICLGDSGGPLVYHGVQLGIASWVVPCARGAPDAYTRVYSYVKWIASKIYD